MDNLNEVTALSYDDIKVLLGDKEILIRQLVLHIQHQEQAIQALQAKLDPEEEESDDRTS